MLYRVLCSDYRIDGLRTDEPHGQTSARQVMIGQIVFLCLHGDYYYSKHYIFIAPFHNCAQAQTNTLPVYYASA